MLLSLLLQAVVTPGLLLILLVKQLFSPPRVVAVCDRGLAVLGCSIWTNAPKRVLAVAEFGQLEAYREQRGWIHVRCGRQLLWMQKPELGAIASVHHALVATTTAAAPGFTRPGGAYFTG